MDNKNNKIGFNGALQFMKTFKKDFHHILRIEAPQGPTIINLERDYYTLGRGSKNSIIIQDKEVSRCHATLIREKNPQSNEDWFWIYDGNLNGKRSTNGLIVNQEYCSKHLLKPKDSILLGKNVKLTYHYLSSKTVKLLKSLQKRSPSSDSAASRATISYKQTMIV